MHNQKIICTFVPTKTIKTNKIMYAFRKFVKNIRGNNRLISFIDNATRDILFCTNEIEFNKIRARVNKVNEKFISQKSSIKINNALIKYYDACDILFKKEIEQLKKKYYTETLNAIKKGKTKEERLTILYVWYCQEHNKININNISREEFLYLLLVTFENENIELIEKILKK